MGFQTTDFRCSFFEHFLGILDQQNICFCRLQFLRALNIILQAYFFTIKNTLKEK